MISPSVSRSRCAGISANEVRKSVCWLGRNWASSVCSRDAVTSRSSATRAMAQPDIFGVSLAGRKEGISEQKRSLSSTKARGTVRVEPPESRDGGKPLGDAAESYWKQCPAAVGRCEPTLLTFLNNHGISFALCQVFTPRLRRRQRVFA